MHYNNRWIDHNFRSLGKRKWIILEKNVDDEYNSLLKNRIWCLMKLPKGKKAIGSKWVFRIKWKFNSDINRYKARLVAKGFAQTKGVNFFETFASVVMYLSEPCLPLQQPPTLKSIKWMWRMFFKMETSLKMSTWNNWRDTKLLVRWIWCASS
jgi:hypothetical protein